MTNPIINSNGISKKVSRRDLIRNSAITATGVVLLPSFFTGCRKEIWDFIPGRGGNGGVQLTPADLARAAANLTRMRAWISDLYPLCVEYEDAVFHTLQSTKEDNGSNWTNFIVDIFLDIATALSAAAAIAGGVPAAVPAFAFLSSILHDWGIGKDKPSNLDEVFGSFEFGHVRTQFVIEQKLSALVDPGPGNDYRNLAAAWTDPIVFPADGKTYTIGDLATQYFPGLGDDYNSLQSAAIISFQQSLWNLVIMKCCTYKEWSTWKVELYDDPGTEHYQYLLDYARKVMYPQNKARYLRGYNSSETSVWLRSWQLGINGNEFPDDACTQLFKDDTPGHIINPDGLFNRTYVFQQFALTKYVSFLGDFYNPNWFDLGSHYPDERFFFEKDWTFTGGVFPKLTH